MFRKHVYRIKLGLWILWYYVRLILFQVKMPWKHYVVLWDDGQSTYYTDGAKSKHPELGHIFLLLHLVKHETSDTPKCSVEDWGIV